MLSAPNQKQNARTPGTTERSGTPPPAPAEDGSSAPVAASQHFSVSAFGENPAAPSSVVRPPPSDRLALPETLNSSTASGADTLNPQLSTLNSLEASVIDLFVQLSRVLGQPRSYAEIYGLLFISAQPLAMDDLIARLRLSKGSASQGLKYLRQLGAIREIYVPGERRVHYEAVAELRNLVSRFLREQILPELRGAEEKLAHIAATLKTMPAADRDAAARRVKMLQSWGKNARRAVSLVGKAL